MDRGTWRAAVHVITRARYDLTLSFSLLSQNVKFLATGTEKRNSKEFKRMWVNTSSLVVVIDGRSFFLFLSVTWGRCTAVKLWYSPQVSDYKGSPSKLNYISRFKF